MTDNVNVKIGKKLYKIRKQQNISQKDLAKKMHYTQCKISRIEKGKQNIELNELMDFSKALNEPVIYLLSDL